MIYKKTNQTGEISKGFEQAFHRRGKANVDKTYEKIPNFTANQGNGSSNNNRILFLISNILKFDPFKFGKGIEKRLSKTLMMEI